MTEDWRSWPMRQKIIQQMDEALRVSNKQLKKTSQEVEHSIQNTAKNKEEYMNYISKILIFLKDTPQAPNITASSNLTALLSNQSGNNPQINQGATSGGQMTIGSTSNQVMQMTSQQQQMQQSNQMINQVAGSSNSMNHNPMGQQQILKGGSMGTQMGTNVANSQGNMNSINPNPMMTSMTRMPQGMQTSNPNDMNWQPMNKVRKTDMMMHNNQKLSGMGNMSQMNQPKMSPMGMSMGQNDQMNMGVTGQMTRPGMMQHRVPSPGYASGTMSMARTPTPTSGSPAMQQHMNPNHLTFISPSPTSVPVASPASVGPRSMNQIGAPSPTGMLGTPGQQLQQPSPLGSNMDDKAYMDKVKHLQHKYADTLKEVAMKFANNDSERGRNVRNLLEVLENPQRRATMETLRKCEAVLERLGMQQRMNRDVDPAKKDNPISVLVKSLNNAMKSSNGSHTIQRTLGPAMKTLFGSDLIPKLPKRKLSELLKDSQPDAHTINDTIQGEVARLPPRFKVNLDSQQATGNDDLTFVCRLDDPHLPCVPPISMTVPANYPATAPRATLPVVDYSVTPFLKRVCEIMSHRQFDLPESCTITKILNTWEMSVRQACSPKPFSPDTVNPLVNLTALIKEEKLVAS